VSLRRPPQRGPRRCSSNTVTGRTWHGADGVCPTCYGPYADPDTVAFGVGLCDKRLDPTWTQTTDNKDRTVGREPCLPKLTNQYIWRKTLSQFEVRLGSGVVTFYGPPGYADVIWGRRPCRIRHTWGASRRGRARRASLAASHPPVEPKRRARRALWSPPSRAKASQTSRMLESPPRARRRGRRVTNGLRAAC
jgi:hypothetical protein